ncbi:MAG: gas vesicle protein [Acidobacteriota bacterium]
MSCASIHRPHAFEAPVSLSEVLDRVLNTGVVVTGEIVISVAGIDLLYLGLNLMLTSVETARQAIRATESRNEYTQ